MGFEAGFEIGTVIGYCIGISIYLCIQRVIAKKFEQVAVQKGYEDGAGSFQLCFWLGLVGYLYVIALPLKHSGSLNEGVIQTHYVNSQLYECPTCKSIVAYGVEECPLCHQKYDWNQ